MRLDGSYVATNNGCRNPIGAPPIGDGQTAAG